MSHELDHESYAILRHEHFNLMISVRSSRTPAYRRQVAQQIIEILKQRLEGPAFPASPISHSDYEDAGSVERMLQSPDPRRVCRGSLGLQLRLRRLERGLSLEDLAQSAQVDAGQISRIERGRSRTRPATLERINAALELHPVLSASPYKETQDCLSEPRTEKATESATPH